MVEEKEWLSTCDDVLTQWLTDQRRRCRGRWERELRADAVARHDTGSGNDPRAGTARRTIVDFTSGVKGAAAAPDAADGLVAASRVDARPM